MVELLVVIGIIALLVAILLPALGRARAQAQRAQCMSNLRQMAVAMRMYTMDNKDRMMPIDHNPGQYWFHLIAKYLGDKDYQKDPAKHLQGVMRIAYCPTAPRAYAKDSWGSATYAWDTLEGEGSYGMNLWMTPKGVYQNDFAQQNYFMRFSVAWGDVPLFGDSNWVGSWPDSTDRMPPNLELGDTPHQKGFFMGRFCIARHDKAINLAFIDGSARRVDLPGLWRLRWHRNFKIKG